MNNKKIQIRLDNYFKEYESIGKRLGSVYETQIKQVNNQFISGIQNIIDQQEDLSKAVKPLTDLQQNILQQFSKVKFPVIDFPDMSGFALQIENYQKRINELISPSIERLNELFQELPPRTREALILLGNEGWYFDLNMTMSELWELKEAISEGNVEEAEVYLVEYFDGQVDHIEKDIIKKCPEREDILITAFSAHRKGDYYLSVPVIIAQTDGICKSAIKKNLFMKRDHVSTFVEQMATDKLMAALLSPLAEKLPISASEHERDENFNQLNRHMVLHGESLDYGTRINSLKSISLINYITQMVKYSEDEV